MGGKAQREPLSSAGHLVPVRSSLGTHYCDGLSVGINHSIQHHQRSR